MLSRLLCATLRQRIVVAQSPIRCLSISSQVMGGHAPVPPVHIPEPQEQYEKDIFGRKKVPSVYQDQHEHAGGDFGSYVGGAVFVLLTVAAVAFYTDVWGMNIKKNWQHMHHKTFTPPKEAEPEPEPVPEPEHVKAAPVEEAAPSTPSESETPAAAKAEESAEASSSGTSPSTEKAAPAEEKPAAAAETSTEHRLPESVEYLLIGSGAAAYYASLSIRARHADAKILMIGAESELPYNRPPLSKELWWFGDKNSRTNLEYKALSGKKRDIFFESDGFFVSPSDIEATSHGGVSLVRERRVVKLIPETKQVVLDDGTKIKYDKCLLATGAKPKIVAPFDKVEDGVKEKMITFRRTNDYRKLDKAIESGASVTIIGGGFLGSELAYSAKRRYPEANITQVIPEHGLLANVLPKHLSVHATDSVKTFGVDVQTETTVEAVSADPETKKIHITLSDGSKLCTDYVVLATGVEPNVQLASDTVKVDKKLGGYLGDDHLQVAPGVWCAGDACAYDSGALGRRRVEHWENAQITGRLAGANMTAADKKFWCQPSFFTKLGPELHINAVGKTDSSLNTVSVYAKQNDDQPNKYHKGVIFYSEGDKVVGCVLLNVMGAGLDVARRLIDEGRPVSEWKELSKLFQLHSIAAEEKRDGESKEKTDKEE